MILKRHGALKARLVIPYGIIVGVLCLGLYLFGAFGMDWISLWVESILEWLRLDPDQLGQMKVYKKIIFYPLFYLLKVVFFLMGLTVVMLCTFLFGNILCAFFWEVLIEQVFILEGKQAWVFEDDNVFKKYAIPLLREMVKELIYVLVFVLVWVITILPVAGPLVSMILGPIAIAYWFGYIVSDFSMSVMALKVKERARYGRAHIPYLTGLGAYALIPLVGVLMYPLFIMGHAYNMTTQEALMPVERSSS